MAQVPPNTNSPVDPPFGEEAMRELYLSIRDDTSLMDNPYIPMTMKKYSIRDFDFDLLFDMATNENVIPPIEQPVEPAPIIMD